MDYRLQSIVSQYSSQFEKSPAYYADPSKRNVYTELNQNLNDYLSQRPQDTEILIKVVGKLYQKTANDTFNIKEALAMSGLSMGLANGAVESEITHYNNLKAEAKREKEAGIVQSQSYAMADSNGRISQQYSSVDASHQLKNTPPPDVTITAHILQAAERNMPNAKQLKELNKAFEGKTAIDQIYQEQNQPSQQQLRSPSQLPQLPPEEFSDGRTNRRNQTSNTTNAEQRSQESMQREAEWRRSLGLDEIQR